MHPEFLKTFLLYESFITYYFLNEHVYYACRQSNKQTDRQTENTTDWNNVEM